MIRGLYTSASGMMAGLKQQEVLADNLANVETVGYKADATTLHDFRRVLIRETGGGDFTAGPFRTRVVGQLGSGTFLNAQTTDFDQGTIVRTDQPLDLALQGDGYFVVRTPAGERLTRDGRFRLDAEGRLTTSDGYFVLGENGDDPIVVPPGKVEIDAGGAIVADGQQVDQIRLRTAATLTRDGSTRYIATGAQTPVTPVVRQGETERSNVDPVKALTTSVGVLQAYTSAQRAFQLQLESLNRAVNDIGRVG